MKKIILSLTFAIILISSMNSVLAFRVYLRPPIMILRTNVTDEPSLVEGYLDVKNENNVTMNVSFTPKGDIAGITQLDKSIIILEPNESGRVNFDIEIAGPGEYRGSITAIYTIDSAMPAALEANIRVIAGGTETTTTTPEIPTGELFLGLAPLQIGIITAVIILLLLGLVWVRKK